MATTQKPRPITDGKSLERRREIKREVESDRRFEQMNRYKAVIHRSIVGDQLPAMYAKGSLRYAYAFWGRVINETELNALRDSMRRPDLPTDAAA